MKNSDQNMISKITNELSSPKHEFLSAKISALAFLLGALMVWVGNHLFIDVSFLSTIYFQITKILFIFILGLSGFIVMVRGELHQIVVIKGKSARIIGFLWCSFCVWIIMKTFFLLIQTLSVP